MAKSPTKVRIIGIIGVFWLLFDIHVVEFAEHIVEPVFSWQMPITIAKVVFADLTSHKAFFDFKHSEIEGASLKPNSAPCRPNFVRSVRTGSCPVMQATRPAVQLCSPEAFVKHALLGNPINIWCFISQHTLVVGRDIKEPDVIAIMTKSLG